jgi:hypothetical protein
MAYEIAIAVVGLGLLVLILNASAGLIRKSIAAIKIEIVLLQTRVRNLRRRGKCRAASGEEMGAVGGTHRGLPILG